VEDSTSDLLIYFGIVLKESDPTLFSRDLLFSDAQNYLHFPPYTEYLRLLYERTGDLTLGLKLLVFPLNCIFMFGAYLVFSRFGSSRMVSALLAVLSSLPFAIPVSAEVFGVGPSTLITPRAIFTAFVPMVFLGYLIGMTKEAHRLLYGVFLSVGCLANLYPISAFLLTQILLLVTIIAFGFRRHAFLIAMKCGCCALASALPYALYHLWRAPRPETGVSLEQFVEIFRWRIPYTYPQQILVARMPEALIHVLTVALIVLPPVLLYRYEARHERRLGTALYVLCLFAAVYMGYSGSSLYLFTWVGLVVAALGVEPLSPEARLSVYFGFATFYVGVGGVLFLQGLHAVAGISPVGIIHQFRAIRFSGFLVFLLAAAAAGWLSRRWEKIGSLRRVAVVALATFVAFMAVRDAYRTHARTRVDGARDDLVALAAWAKGHTNPNALFVLDSPLFRVLAKRSIVASAKDTGMFIVARRHVLESYRRVTELEALRGRWPALEEYARKYGADFLVVYRREVPLEGRELLYQNSTYAVVMCRSGRCG
jgi:hypothetical protein